VDVRAEWQERSPLAVLLASSLALGLIRVAGRFVGLAALLGVVVATVAALTVGIVVLRVVLLH